MESIPFIRLQEWVKELRGKIRQQSGIDQDLNDYFQQLNGAYTVLDKKIMEMATFSSQWEKQDKELAKQIDIQLRQVIEMLHLKERPSVDTVFQFNERLGERIDQLLLLLEKSDSVSEEIKSSESLISFKDSFITDIQKLLGYRQAFEIKLFKSGLRTVQTLLHKVELLHHSVLKRDKLQQKLKEKRERLDSAEIKKKEKEVVLAELKKNPLYQHFSQIQERKNQLQSQLNGYLDEVRLLFLNLKSGLENYKKMGSNRELLKAYIEDPASAFVNDEGLTVVHLMEHVKAVIHEEKMFIEGEELILVQSTLEKATSQYLGGIQQQCFSLKRQLESGDINSGIDQTYSLKVEDGQYRYTHFRQQSRRLREEIIQLEEEYKERKERIKREQQLFENLVRIGLQREIKVIL